MKESKVTFYSARNIPLIWTGGVPDGPVLTMELYSKWYELFVIGPGVISISFDKLEAFAEDESAYCDHVPNPKAVYRFAKANGYHLDEQAYEMIIGRWELEYLKNYNIEEEEDEERIREKLEDAVFVQEGEDPEVCPQCDGPAYELGKLGKNTHYRCRNCGSDHYKEPDDA